MRNIHLMDAFADKSFEGNPAAVMHLDSWPPDATSQVIAEENNLAEMPFFVNSETQDTDFHLRKFTPAVKVKMRGKAVTYLQGKIHF